MRLWDVGSGTELMVLNGHEDIVESTVFSPDGSQIASGSWDKSIRIWDAVNGTELAALRGHDRAVISVAFDSSGIRIVSGSNDHTVPDRMGLVQRDGVNGSERA